MSDDSGSEARAEWLSELRGWPDPDRPGLDHSLGQEMSTDALALLMQQKRQRERGNGAALAAAYRQHEEVEEAVNSAVAHLAGVADSQELADDLLELEELRDRIWDHLFVGSARDETDSMRMGFS